MYVCKITWFKIKKKIIIMAQVVNKSKRFFSQEKPAASSN